MKTDFEKLLASLDDNKSILFSTACTIVEVDDAVRKELVKAKKIAEVDEDLLCLKFVLCHEGINNNKDGFILEEMQKSFETAIHKDLNVEHSKNIIGVITTARLIEKVEDASFAKYSKAEDFIPHIECDAVVYQYKFPEEAQDIRDRHAAGNLAFSMETWFKAVHCKKCDATFRDQSGQCEHITGRFSAASDEDDARWLIDTTYAGAGVVKNPADKKAKSITVARHLEEWDFEWIIDQIGGDFDNLAEILQQFVAKLLESDIVDKDKLQVKLQELIEKMSLLTVANKNNNNNNNNHNKNQAKGGLTVLQFETIEDMMKSEAFIKALADAVKEKTNKADVDKSLEQAQAANDTLKGDITAKDEEIVLANKATEDAKKEFSDFKAAQAIKELSTTRYDELVEAGVNFPEDEDKLAKAKTKLGNMSEDDYVEHKEFCLANIVKKAENDDLNTNDDDLVTADLSTLRMDNFASAQDEADIDSLIEDAFGSDSAESDDQ